MKMESEFYPYAETTENIGEVNTYPTENIPEFADKWEENEYCHGVIAQALNNLADRIKAIEDFLQKFPEPGPDMIKYRPDGHENHLNIKELFDDVYSRLNRIDEKS